MSDKKVFSSIANLCREKGVDKKLIRAASSMGLPGFNANRTINWEILEPAIKQNEAELKKRLQERSIDDLRREEKELGNEIKRLEIKKREGQYVDPTEWYQWHAEFGSKLSTAIKTTRKHLIAKCQGYEDVIDNEMIALFSLINGEIEKCRQR